MFSLLAEAHCQFRVLLCTITTFILALLFGFWHFFSSLWVLACLVFSFFLSVSPCSPASSQCMLSHVRQLAGWLSLWITLRIWVFAWLLERSPMCSPLPLLYYQSQLSSVWGSFCSLSGGLFQHLCWFSEHIYAHTYPHRHTHTPCLLAWLIGQSAPGGFCGS